MWFNGSISEAIQRSKNERKVFVVFVEGDDEISRKMNDLYGNFSAEMSSLPIVAVKLNSKSENCKYFSQIYPVIVVPSTYFIDNNGVPIEIIAGAVENVSEFRTKVMKIVKDFKLQIANDAPSASVAPQTALSQTSVQEQSEVKMTKPETSDGNVNVTSDSTPSVSNVPLESRVEKAKSLLEAIRVKKQKDDEEKAKNEEITRRKEAKDTLNAKRLREEKEAEEIVNERERNKREEKMARERVLAQIAADRAERKARNELFGTNPPVNSDIKPVAPQPGPSHANSGQFTRIQFRLSDGSSKTNQFQSNDTLSEARTFVSVNFPIRRFTLSTAYPRHVYREDEYSMTFNELGLSPTAVLLVIPDTGRTSSNPTSVVSSSFIWSIIALIFSPLTMLWVTISGYLWPQNTVPSQSSQRNPNEKGKSKTESKPNPLFRSDGNVRRLRNADDDDKDNNTWNGNSTQQEK